MPWTNWRSSSTPGSSNAADPPPQPRSRPPVSDPAEVSTSSSDAAGSSWSRPPPWSTLGEPLRILAVAVQFLTRLPVPRIPVVDGDLRRATAAFPLVGLIVGAVGFAAFAATSPLLGPTVAAVVAVLTTVAVTGAFHEDGLADTFDGLWGGWEPARRLEIMRDSRIGTYGGAALILGLGLRVTLLAQLELGGAAQAILVGHVVSRAGILLQIRWLPPVTDRGTGAQVAEPIGGVGLGVAAVTTAAVCAASLGAFAAVPLAAALLGVGALRRAARRKLGGLTGDVLGATQQVGLLLATASVVAMSRAGLV